jgi:hypothetical protein
MARTATSVYFRLFRRELPNMEGWHNGGKHRHKASEGKTERGAWGGNDSAEGNPARHLRHNSHVISNCDYQYTRIVGAAKAAPSALFLIY